MFCRSLISSTILWANEKYSIRQAPVAWPPGQSGQDALKHVAKEPKAGTATSDTQKTQTYVRLSQRYSHVSFKTRAQSFPMMTNLGKILLVCLCFTSLLLLLPKCHSLYLSLSFITPPLLSYLFRKLPIFNYYFRVITVFLLNTLLPLSIMIYHRTSHVLPLSILYHTTSVILPITCYISTTAQAALLTENNKKLT